MSWAARHYGTMTLKGGVMSDKMMEGKLAELLPVECEQQPGEPPLWYTRFLAYTLLGPTRSLLATYRADLERRGKNKHPKNAPHVWSKASRKWNWGDRAFAFDMLHIERDLVDWDERRTELREADYAQGNELRELVAGFLEVMPRFIRGSRSTTTDDDGNTHTVEFVRMNISLNQLALALVRASKLQRLAADEPTERIAIEGAALDAAIEHELARLGNSTEAGFVGTPARTDEELQ